MSVSADSQVDEFRVNRLEKQLAQICEERDKSSRKNQELSAYILKLEDALDSYKIHYEQGQAQIEVFEMKLEYLDTLSKQNEEFAAERAKFQERVGELERELAQQQRRSEQQQQRSSEELQKRSQQQAESLRLEVFRVEQERNELRSELESAQHLCE